MARPKETYRGYRRNAAKSRKAQRLKAIRKANEQTRSEFDKERFAKDANP